MVSAQIFALFAALSALVCAALLLAAVLVPAPTAVLPFVVVTCLGCPMAAAYELARAIAPLRDPAVELRRDRGVEARDQLTAQELQVARMAASGLSNREIGQRLYLSHRTVGAHLYRVFPKLDITSRSQLADALASYTEL